MFGVAEDLPGHRAEGTVRLLVSKHGTALPDEGPALAAMGDRAHGRWGHGRNRRSGRCHLPTPRGWACTPWADFLRSQADALLACDFLETVTPSGRGCTCSR